MYLYTKIYLTWYVSQPVQYSIASATKPYDLISKYHLDYHYGCDLKTFNNVVNVFKHIWSRAVDVSNDDYGSTVKNF